MKQTQKGKVKEFAFNLNGKVWARNRGEAQEILARIIGLPAGV